MKHKNNLRIIFRKLLISGLFGVAFFIAAQTQAANSITISSLTSSYKNYVVTAPKKDFSKLVTSLQAQTISSLTSAYQNYIVSTTPSPKINISDLTSAYKSYITPGSVPNTTPNAIVVAPPKTTPVVISANIKTTPLKVATATRSEERR